MVDEETVVDKGYAWRPHKMSVPSGRGQSRRGEAGVDKTKFYL